MKIRLLLSIVTSLAFIACTNSQQELPEVKLKNKQDSLSYAIGVSFGTNLVQSPIEEIDALLMAKGFQEAFNEQEVLISPEAANQFLSTVIAELQVAVEQENLEEGQQFLEENKKNPAVQTTESGLQYIVLEEGDGPVPEEDDNVRVHYHGTLIDGTVFDSSVDRGEPAEFNVSQVIEGWQEALTMMPVGSKWKLFIPTDLAYGQRVRPGGPIQANMALIFEVELLDILEEEEGSEEGSVEE